MTRVTMPELRLGDTVRLADTVDEGYSSMTVQRIENNNITFFRPYVHVNPTVFYGNKVITYIGIEEFAAPIYEHREYELLSRPLKGE